MKLKEFTCVSCASVDLLTGGTCGHLCNPCKVARGMTPGRTPQEEAHKQVAQAIRIGHLRAPRNFSCADCQESATEYDHRDYGRPLDVEPVCRGCNARRGPAVGAILKRELLA